MQKFQDIKVDNPAAEADYAFILPFPPSWSFVGVGTTFY